MVELPDYIKCSRATLDNPIRKKKGLSFELNDWKPALDPQYAVPEYKDTRYDGIILPCFFVDAKLVLSNYFYLSHREYLFAKANDVLYALYREDGEYASLFCACTWSDLNEKDHLERYENGEWVMCEETGKLEAPWSVRVLHAKSLNLL